MKRPPKRKIRISIFVKIALPLIASMGLIHLVLATTILPLMRPGPPPMPHGNHHGGRPGGPGFNPTDRIAADFKAAETAFALSPTQEAVRRALPPMIDVSYEGRTASWSTKSLLPSWELLQNAAHSVSNDPNAFTGFFLGRHFYAKEVKEGRMILFSPSLPNPLMAPPFWVMMGGQIAGVLLLCYAFLAWQLRPIKKLNLAMSELAKGNFDYRVNLKDSGEFGALGDGFDQMAQQIAAMMKAKEELILGVSHELRSPLASINVLVELIKDPKRRDQIRTHVDRMETLVAELLESHRITSPHVENKFEVTSIQELFAGLGKLHADNKRIAFHSDDAEIEVVRTQFDRLLINLIENALKYSKGPVEVSAKANNDTVIISVTDSGPGIPATDIPNIFEPFYRVEKSRNRDTGGFGLGLYLCAKITRLHHGEISVVNNPNGGCTFFVRFPKKSSPWPHASVASSSTRF